eukprot:COSAG05_NODE_753_length_7528_cov_4.065823_2_plen_52_part_00
MFAAALSGWLSLSHLMNVFSPGPERAHKEIKRNQDLWIFFIFHACAHYFKL